MKKRITSILLALVLCLSLLPTSVLADETQPPLPFELPSDITVADYNENGYTYDSDWNRTPDTTVPLYTVAVPYGTQELTLSFSEEEERIAYGYNSAGTCLNSCAADATNGYADNGKTGETKATVRLVNDKFADYIRVQTPYDESLSSTTLYAVTFEYTYTFTAAVNGRLVNDADIAFDAGAYLYKPWVGEPTSVPVFTVTVPQGTGTVGMEFTDNVLLYNYASPDNFISGWYGDATVGEKNATVSVDANNDGAFDFIQVQKPYNSDWSGGELLYVLTFDDGTTHSDQEIGETSAPTVDSLLAKIAASYTENSSEWNIMDMAAYAKTRPNAASKTSANARQAYINSAIASLQAESLTDTACDKAILSLTGIGADVTKLYPVNSNTPINAISLLNGVTQSSSAWSAPYTLAAYAQGDYDADTYVDALLTAVLANQEENGSWDEWGTIDTTGNVIAALAFYKDSAKVGAAIDKAVNYLSRQQKNNGAFDNGLTAVINANSTAMVIIGLAANGVNPATDPRFIKYESSALDGLLSFALSDGSGFGYTNNSAKNNDATEQGFRALIAAAQVIATGEAYNVYDFSDIAVSPVRATGAENTGTPAESTGEAITVYVTIKGNVGDYWLNRYPVTVPGEGATVYHAFTAACEANGITQTGAVNGYVRTLEKSGKTLSEFTNGANSGWLYRVEGKDFPTVGLTSFSIENGDSIIWYYTNDWTVDDYAGSMVTKTETAFVTPTATAVNGEAKAEVSVKNVSSAIAAAKADGAKEIVIAPVIKGNAGKVSVELPKTAVNDIVESSDAALNIQTDVGSIDIPNDTLSEILKAAGSTDIAMSVEKVNPTAVKDSLPAGAKLENAVAVEFSITSGDKAITSFGGKALEVFVPVNTKKFADGKTYTAFVVSADGKVETTTAKIVSGEAVVEMRHFSTVVITDQVAAAAFSDVAADTYYYDAVLWAAGNGVTAGTDDTHFSPNRPCTRAQVATFLWRAAGCPKAEGKTPFTDVAADTYYSDAVTWAYEQGITGGTSATTFSPNTAVTRAQVVTFLYRYEKPAAGTAVNPFADVQKNAYYYDAVQWAYADGVTDGTDETHFSPNTVCTRGQIVTFLYRDFDSELSESSGVEMRLAEAAAYVLKTTPAPRFGSVGGEWAVLGLARSGSAVPESYYADYYTALEKTVSEAKGVLSTRKYTEYSRVIVALAAIGIDARNVAGYDLTVPLGDYDNTVKQGTSGPVWALIALDSRNYPMPICPDAATSATRQMYIDRLLATQNTDGGWGIGAESASDVDMTAMALQALAKYQEQKAVAAAAERALAFLETAPRVSSESTAQVITALCELGKPVPDELTEELIAYHVSGGGYCHVRGGGVNRMSSEQALYALAAVQRVQTGMPSLYRMER